MRVRNGGRTIYASAFNQGPVLISALEMEDGNVVRGNRHVLSITDLRGGFLSLHFGILSRVAFGHVTKPQSEVTFLSCSALDNPEALQMLLERNGHGRPPIYRPPFLSAVDYVRASSATLFNLG